MKQTEKEKKEPYEAPAVSDIKPITIVRGFNNSDDGYGGDDGDDDGG